MADTSSSWSSQNAVLDMDDVAGSDHSDYETNFSTSGRQGSGGEKMSGTYMDSMKQRLQENVTNMMWQSGKERATKAWNIYGNLDILRPYFNVEPHEVRSRLVHSLLPQRPSDERQRVPRELYGPMMIIFTLIALLLFQMKTAEHRVEEGTLMGTSFGVCFTYWLGASGLVWVLSYVCNTHLTLIQILSMMGYGLGGHCVVIFLGTIIHTSHDHLFFYALWAVVGGLSSLRMVSIVLSRTHGQTQRMIVCGAVAALNLLFLLYLHFAYHQIVEGNMLYLHFAYHQIVEGNMLYLHFAYHQIVEDLSEVFASHHNPVVADAVGVNKGDDSAVKNTEDMVTEAIQKAMDAIVNSEINSHAEAKQMTNETHIESR
ncbi:protein YIPF3-like isoform X4 [Dreissena polymorpha]|uniref:protein YIPF3-like isoform X3 n=1 Tax=Dreissena polymorpha TaxID=45954 RepID=UPI0022655179|nr:protein YIPF3-like isoform X3 [Dreissena polymorpha]XP_052226517.1 protein YIPF3-like isoform X4 [Dreissena polymorpha]